MDPSAPHLRPWRRRPYLVVFVGWFLVLIAWIVGAVSMFISGPELRWMCPMIVVGCVLIGATASVLIRHRRGLSGARAEVGTNEDALTALRAGRYEEAAHMWNDLCHDARLTPPLHVLYVHNLGAAWLHQGRLAESRALMERARASGWLHTPALASARPTMTVGLALSLALAGELRAACYVLAELDVSASRRAMIMLVEAVLAARAGRRVELDEGALRDAESSLMPSHIRALRLLEVFTRTRGGGAYREGTGGDGVDAIGIRPGELDFLAAEWPEVRAFMGARGLLAE